MIHDYNSNGKGILAIHSLFMHLIWIVKCSCHKLQEDKSHNGTQPSLTSHSMRTV